MAQQVSSGFTYEVFLSFRGFDTRYNFTGNLYKALKDKGIHTFMDDRELQGGEEITPSLLKAIENSRIAIIVFSENYADSSFCLDELVKIIDVVKGNDRLVLPVFYGVEPTHLRNHTSSYGIALAQHEKKLQSNIEKLQKWKIALNQAANLSGHTFDPNTGKEYEYKLIGKIVDMVSNKISRIPLHVAGFRVGLESRVLKLKSLLNMGSNEGVSIVGIHGIGGIGKTTLAREIYNSIANEFEGSCFLEDVRKHELVHFQETLLHGIVRDKNLRFGSVSQGISIIKQRLHTKKILLILDDVDDLKQLEALVGGCDWYGPGSKVIITTRDQQLLKSHEIEKTYEVEGLNKDEALELLMMKAFKNNNVDSSYEEVLNRVVKYASGLPLALEVVGSNLCGKHIEEWDSTLDRYKRGPHQKIQKILQVSFDTLEKEEKNVFLDIACLFRGYKLRKIKDTLHAHYGHCIKYHIKVLVEKSLVKINHDKYVTLHDLIVDMGKNIVLQESHGKRSRLWLHEDLLQVLKYNVGTNKTEIIHLDFPSADDIVDWSGKAFKKMINLKILMINGDGWINLKTLCTKGGFRSYDESNSSKVPKHFPTSLSILEWNWYPFEFIPLTLNKKFENMTVLKFDGSKYLIEIPDVSGVPNLEIFSFYNCENLIRVHKSVGFLSKLKILDVDECMRLESFPPIIKLPSLQELGLSYTSLESFPEISGEMKNITEFALHTRIEKFPSLFQKLTGLCNLTIESFNNLTNLPISILMMPSLSWVSIDDCRLENDNPGSIVPSNIKVLHLEECELSDEILLVVLKLVPNVEELNLGGNNFTIIPECIKECHFLKRLLFNHCPSIKEMRGIPPNLKYLDGWNFKLPISILMMPSLSWVSIDDCQLENDNVDSIVPSNIKVLHLKSCELSDEILLVLLKLVPNVEELNLTESHSFTIIPECIKECRYLKRLSLDNCEEFEEMKGVPPNLKYLDARNCKLLTDFPLESMLLNQKLHEDGGTKFHCSGRVETIPEWFEHQSRGTSISFWFRKSVPAIALFFHIKWMAEPYIQFRACMKINGNIHHLRLMEDECGEPKLYIYVRHHDTYVGDVQLQDMGVESELDEALLRNEWIHAQVLFYDDEKDLVMKSKEVFIKSGIHVFKQKTNMEDIRFTNPYERKRKLDDYFNSLTTTFP